MKNEVKHGHSARRGNAVSPYHKYGKAPYRYSDELRQWERKIGKKENEYERA
jgi:hypothetical protein